jgi:mRNA interferase YafQ
MPPTTSNRYPKSLQSLPPRRRDHELSGEWGSYRECPVKPDPLLIYRKPDAETLWLARLESLGWNLEGC